MGAVIAAGILASSNTEPDTPAAHLTFLAMIGAIACLWLYALWDATRP
jgi:hypothetical protein